MKGWRFAVGITASLLVIANGVMHTLVGWKVMRAALDAAGVGSDVVDNLGLGWTFGGVAMFAFGAIAIASFLARKRNPQASLGAVAIIALAYLLFGIGAFVASRFNPFFLVFIVPGALLGLAVWPEKA
ncbi:MAG TPA: hypothetical protein VFV19_05705 [Candidatus Polarisedimenticolaceae bacterium]|nr:hypothetical protein [Candidatus Polarisedimenticolaceae bacterium]